jgi:sugar (pentulose or hexulose) kinase
VTLAAEPFVPRDNVRAPYDEAYQRYRKLYDAVEEATT